MVRISLILTLLAAPALANIPSAYLACKDKAEQDACRLVGPRYGACVRDALCEDDPADDVDVCVLCVDPCWGKDHGAPCLQTLDNSPGVCEVQDRCTDREETSFMECNRCVPGAVDVTEPDEGCNSVVGVGVTVPWLLIFLVGGLQFRRKK